MENNEKNFKDPFEQTFDEALLFAAEQDKYGLVNAILTNAKNGDASSMKLLQAAFESGKFKQDEKLKISPEQFKAIIKLAAERLT